MGWYYLKEEEKIGPVSKEQIDVLIHNGVIKSDTKIWDDESKSWKIYEEIDFVLKKNPTVKSEQLIIKETEPKKETVNTIVCDTCGLSLPANQMSEIGEKLLCETCRKEYFKDIKASMNISKSLPYAGFLVRALGKIIDITVLGIIYAVLTFLLSLIGITGFFPLLLFMFISTAYSIYFVGTYSATLGKMVLGMEIIIPDGTAVDYKIATYRHLAEGLRSLGLYLGYFMALMDDEKRTLHDRICNTRVVFR